MTALGLGKVNAMTNKFKVGDIVTCVDSVGCAGISKGRDYTVLATYDGYVNVLDYWGQESSYSTFRFKLKEETTTVSTNGKIKSDGGSSAYYQFPDGAKELNDLIEHKDMSFARGNMFKALYRLGEKEGIDVGYDLNKMQLFLDRLKEMHKKGKRL